jgi:hypothetical protein
VNAGLETPDDQPFSRLSDGNDQKGLVTCYASEDSNREGSIFEAGLPSLAIHVGKSYAVSSVVRKN